MTIAWFSLGLPSHSFLSARGGRGGGGGALHGLRLLGTELPVVQFIELLFVSIVTISDNLSVFSSVNYHYQLLISFITW